MSQTWLCIPSARPATEANKVLELWKSRGYMVALWRDTPDDPPIYDLLLTGEYPGYARAVNALVKEVLTDQPDCDWVVTGGDDVCPDPNHTGEEIAEECTCYFRQLWYKRYEMIGTNYLPPYFPENIAIAGTFGVMQATGDRWGERPELGCTHPLRAAYIERICGSPWLGREWCQRANQGQGPLYPDFFHMFVDEFLQASATKQGVLWKRPDLTHLHHHWQRSGSAPAPPPFLTKVSGRAHWDEAEALFNRLKARNFVDGDPLPMEISA